ncbi:DUF1629 domain-containing protein [Paenibacillus sp. FSL H7-0756]|uniref:imm11 family protein n=1 Tax=unclassified Paenibacillus TaxID=185978 RepID=UPI0030FAACD2
MKVYDLKVKHSTTTTLFLENYNELSLHTIREDFQGQKLLGKWEPVKIQTYKKRKFNEFPYLIDEKPIVSYKAMNILMPYISTEVEFLPLIHDELDIFMINVINILDCVDWQKSKAKWLQEKYFMGFDKLVFDYTKIPEQTYLFKIKEQATSKVYVTELFKELIEEHQLPGLDFSVVYDSEFTEEMEQVQQRKYEAALQAIEHSKGTEFSYEEARILMEQGKAVASGKWRMLYDEKGELWLGELMVDLKYEWGRPAYIPPILLGYLWHEVDYTQIKSKLPEE